MEMEMDKGIGTRMMIKGTLSGLGIEVETDMDMDVGVGIRMIMGKGTGTGTGIGLEMALVLGMRLQVRLGPRKGNEKGPLAESPNPGSMPILELASAFKACRPTSFFVSNFGKRSVS